MPLYDFVCDVCDEECVVSRPMSRSDEEIRCSICHNKMRRIYGCNVIGTETSFGIGKSFVDKKTGKEIKDWRSWEKAGFTDANELVKTMPDKYGDKNFVQQKMKEKTDKIKAKNRITVGAK